MGNINNGVLDGVRRIGAKVRDLTIDGQIPGASLGFRMRGANTAGPPLTGTWKTGDETRDRAGNIFICTAGGRPGAWVANYAQLAGLLMPTGATAETFPYRTCAGTPGGPSSGQVTCAAIPMIAGVAVNNLTFTVFSAAVTVTNGWYALLDSGLVVRAVSAAQSSGQWGSGTVGTGVTLPLTGGYATAYSGLYYVAVSTTAATPAKFYVFSGLSSSPLGLTPVLCGISGTQSAPPAIGATMSALTANGGFYYYAYTS
jgi:hypothetical protein